MARAAKDVIDAGQILQFPAVRMLGLRTRSGQVDDIATAFEPMDCLLHLFNTRFSES